MFSLAKFLPTNGASLTSTSSARLRLETVSRRCKLIVLEDRLKCIQILETFNGQSCHTPLLIQGLRGLTAAEAQQELFLLERLIDECEAMNLKRLECEVHLIWLCVQLVLRNFGLSTTDAIIKHHLQRSRALCKSYPDSAGLLAPIFRNVQRATDPHSKDNRTFYAWDFKALFWQLPKYQTGALAKCPHGHLYSSLTWTDCPECGREVIVASGPAPMPLKTDDFLLAMKTLPRRFNADAYRRKPLTENQNLENGIAVQKEEVKVGR